MSIDLSYMLKRKVEKLKKVSVNGLAHKLVEEMMDRGDELCIEALRLDNGVTVVDTGVNVRGGYKAGEYVIKISLGGLGEARVTSLELGDDLVLPAVNVYTDYPAAVALSMYIWLNVVEAPHLDVGGYTAWVSGPGRARAREPEKVFSKIDYRDESDVAVLVVQPRGRELPPAKFAEHLARRCGVSPENLYLVVTPTYSITGSVQVSARSLEDWFWRLTEFYGIPYHRVEALMTVAAIAPISPKVFKEPCAWADDMIRYGSMVHAWIYSEDGEDLKEVVEGSVIENYPDVFGKSFYDVAVLERKYIYPDLDLEAIAREGRGFVFAQASIYDTRTGRLYTAGRIHRDLVRRLLVRPW